MKTAFGTLLFGFLLVTFSGTARAQGPVAGQPYQVPAGYQSYGAGTLIAYGGYNYVIQSNGTMLLSGSGGSTGTDQQGPSGGQAYQVPAGYQGYGAGTVISYGGYNYVIQGNGTMLLSGSGGSSAPTQTYQQPQYTYQQPQYTYQQPQYTQPTQTYQSQYSYPNGGGGYVSGVGGGRTSGNSNVAIDGNGVRHYLPGNPGNSGMQGQNFNPFGNFNLNGLRW